MYNFDFTFITAKRREEIYNQVWTEPLITVAAKYKISDTALRNHCKKLDIPLPPRGYWAKIQNDLKVEKTRLPQVTREVSKYVHEYLIKYRDDEKERTDEDILSGKEFNMLTEDTIEHIKKSCSQIKVPGQLRNPSKEIEEHRDEMEYRKNRDKELKSFNGTRYYYTVSAKYRGNKEVLPIEVSLENVNRAYRIVDTLMKSLYEFEGRIVVGPEIRYSSEPIDIATLKLLGTKFIISLHEKIKAKDKLLVFSALVDKDIVFETTDLPDKPLEDQLGNIFYQLILLGNRYRAYYTVQRRKEERKWEEEKLIRREQERLKTLQKIRENCLEEIKLLLVSADDWEKAERLRKFLNETEKKIELIDKETDKEQIRAWIQEQRFKADWIDPLVYLVDEELGESKYLFNDIINNDISHKKY